MKDCATRPPVYIDNLLDTFPYLERDETKRAIETTRLSDLYKHRDDYTYTTAGPVTRWRQHPWESNAEPKFETFEQFFWRLQDTQDGQDVEAGNATSGTLRELQEKIAESHLWRRLKWLGLPDWRSDNHAARYVGSTLPEWCISLRTISIRGKYTRDRAANEIESVHHHVCRLILGIEKIAPTGVTRLELRLSVPFLRYLLEKLQERRPNIKHVGIDLGAWIQVFPLGDEPDELKDRDIRESARLLARDASNLDMFRPNGRYVVSPETIEKQREFETEQDYSLGQHNFYRDRSGTFETYRPLGTGDTKKITDPTNMFPDGYDFFEDLLHNKIKRDNICPLDHSAHHADTRHEVNCTRANTLPRLFEKLYLSRRKVEDAKNLYNINFRAGKPQFRITREGAHLFGLEGETENRSFDPIHPLTLTQMECKATSLSAGSDYRFYTVEGLKAVYPWLEETFRWRPVFDWDWFMVPGGMSGTENTSLVTIKRSGDSSGDAPASWGLETRKSDGKAIPGKALQTALAGIKKQFGYLNDANVPVHLLIGRRNPDFSSCYWGWPYTKESWEKWIKEPFSANLDTVAQHVNILSILYDLRNPLDADRLSLIEEKRPFHPPNGTCPTRACLLEKHNNGKCPFVEKYPGLRNHHARPQVSASAKWQKKPDTNSIYTGLAHSGSSAPPTGESAAYHADPDANGVNESFPLYLARHSAYLRETVGWQRFWNKYATSFTNLTALHIRMPRCHDSVGSWRLAKLLNSKNGWTNISYVDERQRVQSEEDILAGFEGSEDKAGVWSHVKELRVWPAGRFVRRSWVWDPLRHVDERFEMVVKMLEDTNEEGGQPSFQRKRYLAYGFEPRTKLDLASHDANIEAGEAESLCVALRQVSATIKAEEEVCETVNGDGELSRQRIPQPERLPHQIPGFGSRFKNTYGHHVRNVAGAQWREELRQMVSYLDKNLASELGVPGGEERKEVVEKERDRLKALLAEEPPYSRIFAVKDDRIALREVPKQIQTRDNKDSTTEDTTDVDQAQQSKSLNHRDTTEKDPHQAELPLTETQTDLPDEAETDTDIDSLFEDSEPDPETIPPIPGSSPPISTPHKAPPSDDRESSAAPPSSPKTNPPEPHVPGASEQSNSSSRNGEATEISNPSAPSVTAIAIAIPSEEPDKMVPPSPVVERATRSPRPPLDEDYTDNDYFDDDGNPTDTEGLYTSPEQSETEEAQPRVKTNYEKMREKRKAEEAEKAAAEGAGEKVGETVEEGMSFMEWLCQASKAANTFAVVTTISVSVEGGCEVEVYKSAVSIKADLKEEDAASVAGTKWARSDTEPEARGSRKKARISEDENEAQEKQESEEPPEPVPQPETEKPTSTSTASPAPSEKRKQPPSPSAAENPVPSKKTKTTKSGRVIKSKYKEEPQSSDEDKDEDAASVKPKRRNTQSKDDYVPPKAAAADGKTSRSDSGDDEKESQPKKSKATRPAKKVKKAKAKIAPPATPAPVPTSNPTPNAAAAATAPTNTPTAPTAPPTIAVPFKANATDPDYARLTVKQLRALAKQRGVRLTGATLKADIVGRFEEDDNAASGGKG